MQKQNDLLMDVSILYRNTQKYYDRMLQSIDLTYAQLPILILIYENEGISMQMIAEKGQYDKGTVTKSVQKLVAMKYVQIVPSQKDKRQKELYTTDKTKQVVSQIYRIRRDWWNHLIKDVPYDKLDDFTNMYQQIAQNAGQYANVEPERIQFFEMKKLSVQDYADYLCTTLSTGGCNFRCPGCQKQELVFLKEDVMPISNDMIKMHFEQRKGVIQGVCIQGGEPLMHKHLDDFLTFLKKKGYRVKVDTNGSFPDRLIDWVKRGLIDFVSVNIKNCPEKYQASIGIERADLDSIQKTIDFLKQDQVQYQFVVDVIREFHSLEDVEKIGKWLKGNSQIILRTYREDKPSIQPNLHACTKEKMKVFANCLKQYVRDVVIE